MKKWLSSAAFAFAVALSPPAFADEAERTLGEIIDDATINTKVKAALIADEDVSGLRINVDTLNGQVTLAGRARTPEQIEKAEAIASSVGGVKSVDNRMIVWEGEENAAEEPPRVTIRTELPAAVAGETRSAGQLIDDAWITAKVKAALMRDEHVPGMQIDVDTLNGVVTLRGQLPAAEPAARAVKLAASIEGVKSVNDELRVPTGAAGRRATSLDARSDQAITDRVKAALSANPEMKNIEVSTQNGVVTLKGDVAGLDQVAKAGEIAVQAEGVESVNNQVAVTRR